MRIARLAIAPPELMWHGATGMPGPAGPTCKTPATNTISKLIHSFHTDISLTPQCRAACDSRSADVFASVFYLPKPRALNYLITELWRGPTGVVQGVLDPLNDAKSRADQLKSICAPVGLRAWELQAGHCPHDEVPVEFNRALIEFVEELVIPHMQQLGSSSGGSTVEAGSLASTSAARS